MTPDQQERLEVLRASLPPVVDDWARISDFKSDELVCVDLEWDGDPSRLTLIGIGNDRLVVQVDWREIFLGNQNDVRAAIEVLVARVPVVYHNADADLRAMRRNGFKVSVESHRQLDDTMLADAVLNSELGHTLEELIERHGKLPQHKDLAAVDPVAYNAADVVETALIWRYAIYPALLRDPAAHWTYRRRSLGFLPIAIEGEERGLRVDQTKPYALYDKYATKIDQAMKLAQAGAGWPLNLNSPDQMKTYLYNVEGLPIQREKGPAHAERKATTDKDAIATLRRLHGTEWDTEDEPTLETAMANIEAGGHPVLEARYLHMGAQQSLSHYVLPFLETE